MVNKQILLEYVQQRGGVMMGNRRISRHICFWKKIREECLGKKSIEEKETMKEFVGDMSCALWVCCNTDGWFSVEDYRMGNRLFSAIKPINTRSLDPLQYLFFLVSFFFFVF